jgi:DNA repair exonuclease SbcCD ATPase subunit
MAKSTKKKAKSKIAKKVVSKVAKKATLESRINANRREIEKIQQKLEKACEKLLREALKHIFKKFPNVKTLSWNQYTPSWNDGDTCVFSCYFESMIINDEEDYESTWELAKIHENLSGNVGKKREEIKKELESGNKEGWELDRLKSDLANLDRDPKEVAEKYLTRKTITDLFESIHDSAFSNMFGEGCVTVTREGSEVSECDRE